LRAISLIFMPSSLACNSPSFLLPFASSLCMSNVNNLPST
jgi:hypothetical protein